MAKVKVWNDNDWVYKEDFMDHKIEIPPHSWIEMDDDQATLFRGSFVPIKKDGAGVPIPEFFKKIRIEAKGGGDAKPDQRLVPDPLVCIACRFKAESTKALDLHMRENHADQLLVDEEAEEEIKRKRGRPPGVQSQNNLR